MISNEISNLNLLGLSFGLLMAVLMILVPRRYAAIPFLMGACYVTLGQRLVVLTLDFTMFRILIFFGLLRLFLRWEIYSLKLNAIDKAIIWYVIASVATYTILWGTFESFINRIGLAYNVIGIYFLFRFLIRDFEDVNRIIRSMAVIIVPLGIAALLENATGRNIFAFLGGISEFSAIRDGKLRCQVTFGDPILAGTFAATLMPLFVGLWFRNGFARKLGIIGFVASSIITYLSSSSGPAIVYLFGIIGFMMWPFRRMMRTVRWGILITIIFLHIIMKAPVWALMWRMSQLVGGTGYHRYELMDAFISHFWEWWLLGTTYTAHWGPFVLPNTPNMVDITNQYILVGIQGGLLSMILFIAVIAYSFRAIGRAMNASQNQQVFIRVILWSMGIALFSHTASYISVAYFDQLVVFWYMLLAMVSACEGIFSIRGDPVKDEESRLRTFGKNYLTPIHNRNL